MTLGSNCGSAAIFASNSSHAFIGKRWRQASKGDGVSTSRSSPVAASTSRKRDGRLVRPFASIACSKCPRNMFPRPCLPLDGLLRHYLPLYPTLPRQGTGKTRRVSIICVDHRTDPEMLHPGHPQPDLDLDLESRRTPRPREG